MFLGHFAVGFAAKRAAPETSLGMLMAAAQFLDLIWPVFVLAGVEHVAIDPGNTAVTPLAFVDYPISHSLLTAAGWAVAVGAGYWLLRRYRTGSLIVGLAVVSHWFLDAVVHRPDLPLYPGSGTFAGLGLWNSVPGTVVIEGALLVAGVLIYTRATKSRDRIGTAGLCVLVGVLAGLYAATLACPPPPGVPAVAIAGLGGFLFVGWAAWFDRHRVAAVH